MLKGLWAELKSGSDIRGVAMPTDTEKVNLNDEVINSISNAFLIWLSRKLNKEISSLDISVGHDSRLSGNKIKTLMITTFSKHINKIYDCGLTTTPAMFTAVSELHCDAAIEITASHLPFNKNGFKFFINSGSLNSNDIEEILELAQNNEKPCSSSDRVQAEIINASLMEIYSEKLRQMICAEINSKENFAQPLSGLKIVVDAGNGAGGFYATDVLAPLGADISGSQFLDPDGNFPNHIPNPDDKRSMDSAVKATAENSADLGIIFDTDVDRAGVVSSSGKAINKNNLIAIASAIALSGNDGGTIVTDSVTSSNLKNFIESELKAKQCRFKRGYKNVINKAILLNQSGVNCPLAIESSGHAAFRENNFQDDGAYLVTKIIIFMVNLKKQGRTLESIIENLVQPAEEQEFRLKIKCKDFKNYGKDIIDKLNDFVSRKSGWQVDKDNCEGIRVNVNKGDTDGWFILRQSLHDPVIVLNVEGNKAGTVEIILNNLRSFFGTFSNLDAF